MYMICFAPINMSSVFSWTDSDPKSHDLEESPPPTWRIIPFSKISKYHPHFKSQEKVIWKGSHNPILRKTYDHLRPSWHDPPSSPQLISEPPRWPRPSRTHEDVSNGGKDVVVGEPWMMERWSEQVRIRRELQQNSSEKNLVVLYFFNCKCD